MVSGKSLLVFDYADKVHRQRLPSVSDSLCQNGHNGSMFLVVHVVHTN
jgi:hypothetical protein